MSNFRLSTDSRNEMLRTLRDLLDAGTGAAKINLYSGTQPGSADIGIGSQVLLATLTCSATSAPDPSEGVLEFNSIAEEPSAKGNGTATWARVTDSEDNVVFDCDVSAIGAGGTIELNTNVFVIGGPVRLTSFAINIPAS